MLSPRTTYCILLAGAFLWCCGFIGAPFVSAALGSEDVVTRLFYEFYRPVCHQMDARSLYLAGEPFSVCSRCSAIYLSFLLGVALFPLVRSLQDSSIPSQTILLLASLPIALDAFGGVFGIHTVTLETRLITGSIFGFTLAFFIIPALIGGLSDSSERSIINHPTQKGFSNARKTV